MASTTPWYAVNLPAGPDGYGKFIDFDEDADLDKFENTEVGSGTLAISDAGNGEMVSTNDANDNDSNEFQWEAETISLNGLNKTVWIFGRMKISDATQSDFRFGAIITDTTFLPGAGTAGASDGFWFGKDDGDALIDSAFVKDGSTFPDDYSKTNGVGTMDTEYHEYAIRVVTDANTLGTGTITYYIDGVPVGPGVTSSALPYDEELAISFGLQNGEAVAKVLTVDYVGIWYPNAR